MNTFLTLLLNGLSLGAIYALIALGFAIIFKASEVVSFMHGSLLLFGAYAIARFAEPFGFWGGVLAGILLTAAVGFLVRHTAGTISGILALVLVVGNMVILVPGSFGELLEKVMPGNAGGALASPVPFNPNLLDPWTGFALFAAEVAAVGALALVAVRRRDA